MAREAARRKEKHVNTLIITSPDEPRGNALCRCYDAPEAPRVYRKIKVCRISAPLHFHEDDGFAPAGDKIHFAARGLHSLG